MEGTINELALFAGAGGGILGGRLLGWRTICAVELDEYARSVLLRRQNDGTLEAFPIWDDIRTFDGRPWRGRVDVVSGGFPCQDISAAGKGRGLDGERSGLWSEMLRIIREVRPRFAFVENSPLLTSRGLDRVLGDLASIGYDAEWGVLSAADVGAPHLRKRFWCVAADAYSAAIRNEEQWSAIGRVDVQDSGLAKSRNDGESKPMADADENGFHKFVARNARSMGGAKRKKESSKPEARGSAKESEERRVLVDSRPRNVEWWEAEPDVGRVAHGVAARVDRLRALGNGQVPLVAASAWRQLLARFGKGEP